MEQNTLNNVIFSKKVIYDLIMCAGYFDPCPANPSFDGLQIDWRERTFVNPPYSQINKWVDKSLNEFERMFDLMKRGIIDEVHIIMLLPVRTDTKWFRKLWDFGCHFIFVSGRLKFNDVGNAPFPSMFVIVDGMVSSVKLLKQDELKGFENVYRYLLTGR